LNDTHMLTEHLFPRCSASFTVQPNCQMTFRSLVHLPPAEADGDRRNQKKSPQPVSRMRAAVFRFYYMIRTPTPRLGLSCGSCEGYHWVFPCKHGRAKPITSVDFARVALVPVWACMIIEVSYLLA